MARPHGILLSRRRLLASSAGALTAALGAGRLPRPGCQANARNLDPKRFDTLLRAVREMKELDFQGFETNVRFVQLNPARESRLALQSIGLEFIAAHGAVPNYAAGMLEKAADQVTPVANQVREFGGRALVLSHPGLSATGEFTAKSLDEKARMLDLAGKRCSEAGVTFAYHNHEPEFENHAAEMTGLLRQTDPKLVFMMLDLGHAWLADKGAVALFREHQSRVFGIHVRDYHDGVSVPLGQGEFPLRDLAEAIRKTGWHGWLIDEEERPDQPVKPGLAATGPSRKTMRAVFGI